MKARTQRMVWIGAGLLALGLATTLILNAFQSNLVFFFTPTQIANGEAPKSKPFRIGGMVVEGSLKRNTEGTGGNFQVTDTAKTVSVAYNGILPDLFKEGKGVVAQGIMLPDGSFKANEVLAKHDENYMPPEAAAALKQAGAPTAPKSASGSK